MLWIYEVISDKNQIVKKHILKAGDGGGVYFPYSSLSNSQKWRGALREYLAPHFEA